MSLSSFYFEQLGSVEMAVKYSTSAVMLAKENLASYAEQSYVSDQDIRLTSEALEVLEINLKYWQKVLI